VFNAKQVGCAKCHVTSEMTVALIWGLSRGGKIST